MTTASVRANVPCVAQSAKTHDPEIIFPGKEMFHPQVLLRIPCYDLLPVSSVTVVPPLAGNGASGAPAFHELTGGEYKTQELIHRSIADLRLLAIPTSCRRVAAGNPN